MAPDGLTVLAFEMKPVHLKNNEGAFRKFTLIIVDIQGKTHLTNCHGMDLSRDKVCPCGGKEKAGHD